MIKIIFKIVKVKYFGEMKEILATHMDLSRP